MPAPGVVGTGVGKVRLVQLLHSLVSGSNA